MLYRLKRFGRRKTEETQSEAKIKSLSLDFKSGDESAFAGLYTRFQKPILRFVKQKISDEEVASELGQEIFLKAFRFRDSYQAEFAFSTWLWTIARNTVSDHLRASRNAFVKTGMDSLETLSSEDIPSPLKNAEALLLRKDQRRGFLKMMKALTHSQKRVLWMRTIHQLSNEEIARKLGLSLTAVRNLSYRARQSLKAVQPALLQFI